MNIRWPQTANFRSLLEQRRTPGFNFCNTCCWSQQQTTCGIDAFQISWSAYQKSTWAVQCWRKYFVSVANSFVTSAGADDTFQQGTMPTKWNPAHTFCGITYVLIVRWKKFVISFLSAFFFQMYNLWFWCVIGDFFGLCECVCVCFQAACDQLDHKQEKKVGKTNI